MSAKIANNVELDAKTTFQLKSSAKSYVSLTGKEELPLLLKKFDFNHNKFFVLGGGSNVILPKEFDGLVLHPAFKGISLIQEDDKSVELEVAAGESWHEFVNFCVTKGYYGLENLTLIPGNVGAAPIQNIGAYGVEVKDSISSVEVFCFKSCLFQKLSRSECRFDYRDSLFRQKPGEYLICSVNFRLSKIEKFNLSYNGLSEKLEALNVDRGSINQALVVKAVQSIRLEKLPDPSVQANVGSFFKNPIISKIERDKLKQKYHNIPCYETSNDNVKVSAAWLVENSGWKGKAHENVEMSTQHALVMLNNGGATQAQVLELSQKVVKDVFARFEINLEIEPIVVRN